MRITLLLPYVLRHQLGYISSSLLSTWAFSSIEMHPGCISAELEGTVRSHLDSQLTNVYRVSQGTQLGTKQKSIFLP